ncbi:MAG: PilZN3 domain-containing protein [Treponemataceae bacterium]
MHTESSPINQILTRFADKTIACSQYALSKLGVDRSHCLLKVGEYAVLCAPFQLGFKRAVLLASLSRQELVFFQRFKNNIAGLSMEFTVSGMKEPLKLFVRAVLAEVGQMRGRDDVGLMVIDFKSTPEDLVSILGSFLESQERLAAQYEDYGKTAISLTPDTAKRLGYNQFAVAVDKTGSRRIQLFSLSSKSLEFLEAASSTERYPGTAITLQLYFRKYRVSVQATVESASRLPSGIVKTRSNIVFSPELVEILDDYWFRDRAALKH